MNELNQALENVTFLKKVLDSKSYSLSEIMDVASALKFLEALEKGIQDKRKAALSE